MLAATDKGRLIATVELVLLVSEPKYLSDPSGFVKTRSVTDIRFATGAKGLRSLAKELAELAETMVEEGYLVKCKSTALGATFEGYELTHVGRMAYCMECKDELPNAERNGVMQHV
jgi:acetoacetate decarboxylase